MALFRRPGRLTPFSRHPTPSDLSVDENGELYWKGKKVRRGNFNLSTLGSVLLGVAIFLSSIGLFLGNLQYVEKYVCLGASSIGIGMCDTVNEPKAPEDS